MDEKHTEIARPWSRHRRSGGTPGHVPAGRPQAGLIGLSRGRRLVASLVGLAVLASGCAGSQGAGSQGAASQGAGSQDAASPAASRQAATRPDSGQPAKDSSGQAPVLPAPDAAIPTDPSRLADSLAGTVADLRRATDDWTRDGDPAGGQAPEPVVLLALREQRVYRYLAREPKVASRTYARLPKTLAARAKDNVTAIRNLLSLARPIKGAARFRVQAPKPAGVLLGDLRRAERRFGVEWEVLAAVMFVETKFGRVRSPSYTGAKGPMQFMPGTWKAYGMGGDIQDTGDALLAAANYLHATGAPRDYRRALYAYNHSQAYVDAVLLHARQMKQDIRNYYDYYNWQVYVITTRGDRRLTGPGL
ncbi:transglycosylase SLT domain-containing protein [Microbispora sp. NPDC049125]|uniref:lytic transglycosylase domain-containing protein n=1 Tax=Microbispora sp. NPDC049125 TaxID=3154929 RepID=UPI0034653906